MLEGYFERWDYLVVDQLLSRTGVPGLLQRDCYEILWQVAERTTRRRIQLVHHHQEQAMVVRALPENYCTQRNILVDVAAEEFHWQGSGKGNLCSIEREKLYPS
jgi:hypothetical protein